MAPIIEGLRLAPIIEGSRLAPIIEGLSLAPIIEGLRLAPIIEGSRFGFEGRSDLTADRAMDIAKDFAKTAEALQLHTTFPIITPCLEVMKQARAVKNIGVVTCETMSTWMGKAREMFRTKEDCELPIAGEGNKRKRQEQAAPGERRRLPGASSAPASLVRDGRKIYFDDKSEHVDAIVKIIPVSGGELRLNGVVLTIPPGALHEATAIRMTVIADPATDQAEAALSTMASSCSPVVRLEPHNLRFQRSITLSVPCASGDVLGEAVGLLVREPLHPVHRPVGAWRMHSNPSKCTYSNAMVTTCIDHFSSYVLCVWLTFCTYYTPSITLNDDREIQIPCQLCIGLFGTEFPPKNNYVTLPQSDWYMPYARKFEVELHSIGMDTIPHISKPPYPTRVMCIPTAEEWVDISTEPRKYIEISTYYRAATAPIRAQLQESASTEFRGCIGVFAKEAGFLRWMFGGDKDELSSFEVALRRSNANTNHTAENTTLEYGFGSDEVESGQESVANN
ncbi:hypothetical protein CYMTET_7494 [Cymbomonas tetramitiformis]|uniref:ZU5 domain-containing protein n=1 Tax=Cymbomonas tetramitiformis TaxID=36881 RepID=A0AAE0LGZ1_9CHLO|nr:hypothetical protein CYMTET_7494 [Cymbomonas tetramitiformis]